MLKTNSFDGDAIARSAIDPYGLPGRRLLSVTHDLDIDADRNVSRRDYPGKLGMKKLSQKHICFNFIGFEKRVDEILEHYGEVDLVIEGHFHQCRTVGKYVSLPSLACQGMVGVMEEGEIHFKTL